MSTNYYLALFIILSVACFLFRASIYWSLRRRWFILRQVLIHHHTFARARIKWNVEALRITTLQTYPDYRMRRIITPGDGKKPLVHEHESNAPLSPQVTSGESHHE